MATAAMRAIRMRCLFDVILASGERVLNPPTTSLCVNQSFSSRVGVAHCGCGVPVEDKGVRRVKQTEEANTVDDRLSDDQLQVACRTSRACKHRAHCEGGHSDLKRTVSLVRRPVEEGINNVLAQNNERTMRTYVGFRKALKM